MSFLYKVRRLMNFSALVSFVAIVAIFLAACSGVFKTKTFYRDTVRKPNIAYNVLTPIKPTSDELVLVLGGSSGGIDAPDLTAQKFAKAGFTTLAIAYFGLPELPKELVEIDINYINLVLQDYAPTDWSSLKVTVVASSRGTELAALAATVNPQIQKLILVSPSSHLWGAVSSNETPKSAWKNGSTPYPYVPRSAIDSLSNPYSPIVDMQRDVMSQESNPAEIPFDKIHANVLLITGGDDQIWPSSLMAEKWQLSFIRNGKIDRIEHLNYPEAGHVIAPNMPDNVTAFEINNRVIRLGGNPHSNQDAIKKSWKRIESWLRAS